MNNELRIKKQNVFANRSKLVKQSRHFPHSPTGSPRSLQSLAVTWIFVLFLLLYALPFTFYPYTAYSQATLGTPIPIQSTPFLPPVPRPTPQSVDRSINVSATVGDYILTVSGIIAPYASVTILSGDTPLSAVVADSLGNFTIKIKVAKGFYQFCLDAIDIKRYGESYSCFDISAVFSNTSDANLYLPPTTGIDRKELIAGETIIVRGYGLPYSYTLIHLSDGRVIYIHTDSTGFYEVKIPIEKAGAYSLFANATFKGMPSVNPQKKLSFSAISQWDNFLKLLVKLITPPLLYVWIILLILILLIIRYLSKKYSQFQRAMRRGWGKKSNSRLLHHAWFVGY